MEQMNDHSPTVLQKNVAEISENKVTVPDNAVINKQAPNTSTNAEDLSLVVKQEGLRKVAAFTTESHLPRAMILTCGWGIAANGFAAGDVIVSNDPTEATAVNAYLRSPAVRKSNSLEFWKRATLPYDTHGKLLTWMKENTRKSVNK